MSPISGFYPFGVILLYCIMLFVTGCGESGGNADADSNDSPKPLVIPAELMAEPTPERVAFLVEIGRASFTSKGCVACHMITGEPLTGPALGGIFGQPIALTDGTMVERDLVYLYRSMVEPNQFVSQAGPVKMPPYAYLDEQTLVGLSYFIRSLTALAPDANQQTGGESDE